MNTSRRYQDTLIGEQLGRLYKGRTELRRKAPLLTISWRDLSNGLKGLTASQGKTTARPGECADGKSRVSMTPAHAIR